MTDQAGPAHRRLAVGLPPAMVWAAIGVLAAAEVAEYLRNQRRRTSHRLGEWWAELERREHRAGENAEIAILARRLRRSGS